MGDALGAVVAGDAWDEVVARFGIDGPEALGPVTGGTTRGMFVVEGMLRALVRHEAKGICAPVVVVHHALLRWMHARGASSEHPSFRPETFDGWLIGAPGMRGPRSADPDCVAALGRAGIRTKEGANADVDGGAWLAAVAPLGFLAADPLGFASEVAALTHGHPTAFLASGFVAALVAELSGGRALVPAVAAARERLASEPRHEETLRAVDLASRHAALAPPLPESLAAFGAGRRADEALAIALFCVLTAEEFEGAVRLAVMHGGASHGTGATVGAILGTLLGEGAIPERWSEHVELRDELRALALDVVTATRGRGVAALSWERYPGW